MHIFFSDFFSLLYKILNIAPCVCVHAKSLQSCPTLFNPMDCSPPGPLSMGFSRQEHGSGLPLPSPGGLPSPGVESASLVSPAVAGGFFTTSASWEPTVPCALQSNPAGHPSCSW